MRYHKKDMSELDDVQKIVTGELNRTLIVSVLLARIRLDADLNRVNFDRGISESSLASMKVSQNL